MAELTVIWWRDIPAQVTAKEGRTRAARELPPRFQEAIDAVRGDRITALLVALVVAVAISFLIASAITSRIKKLADSAAKISQGQLDRPLEGTGGRAEKRR